MLKKYWRVSAAFTIAKKQLCFSLFLQFIIPTCWEWQNRYGSSFTELIWNYGKPYLLLLRARSHRSNVIVKYKHAELFDAMF